MHQEGSGGPSPDRLVVIKMNSDLTGAESVGQQLRQARETQELSLEQIASATFIKLRYLKALEAGDFQSLPSQTQARGFLRTYANLLKLDPTPLLAALGGNEPGADK